MRSWHPISALVMLASASCKSPGDVSATGPIPKDAAESANDGMDPVERAKRFSWPDGMNGFKTGMTPAQFDAACGGGKLDVGPDGNRVCLWPPAADPHSTMIAGHFCGGTVCELLVSRMRATESDAEWLAAFEKEHANDVTMYGPPRVEESAAAGCEGDRVVACTGDGRATRRYSWSFIGRDKEFGLVVLVLQPIAVASTFRNAAWLEREHQDTRAPRRP